MTSARNQNLHQAILAGLALATEKGLTKVDDISFAIQVALDDAGLKVIRAAAPTMPAAPAQRPQEPRARIEVDSPTGREWFIVHYLANGSKQILGSHPNKRDAETEANRLAKELL